MLVASMGQKEKLLIRLQNRPKDFTYRELSSLLNYLGYTELKTGKTSGSRRAFYNEKAKHLIRLHKPHSKEILRSYQIDLIIDEFIKQKLL